VDLSDPVLEGCPFDLILYLAIPENAFQSDELPLLESLGELREIPPGKDAMPFGAILVVALVVLPALLSCDVEDDVLFVVLSGLASAFCPRRPMRMTLLIMWNWGGFASAIRDATTGCRARTWGCHDADPGAADWPRFGRLPAVGDDVMHGDQ
jgi:hypothetical protein